MHKCQHNDNITLFCVSEHCQWKQASGCQCCIKKYHNHFTNSKFISESELLQLIQKLSLETVAKPNSRKIQQSLYSYFNNLKNQFTNSLDLICKDLINCIGSPYLSQKNLLNVYKRVKNKEYKRLQQKQLKKFYETAQKANPLQISKQQTKIYKQQLRKSQKFILGLQNVFSTYQNLFKNLNETFVRQKTSFDALSSLLKQTIENADLSINLSQFHQRQMEKNKAERAQKLEKNNNNDIKKILNEYDSLLSTQYSSRLASATKQKVNKTPQVNKAPSNIKQDNFYDSSHHKFGVKDFGTLEKLQKSDSQQIKTKRPILLDKKQAMTLSTQIQAKTQRKRSDIGLIQDIKMSNDKVQRHKITFPQRNEYILTDICSDNSTKKSQPTPLDKRQSFSREKQISVRKEQLIGMMKNQSLVIKNGDKEKVREQSNYHSLTNKPGLLEKNDMKVLNNNSLLVKPKIEQYLNEFNSRKNYSTFLGDKNPRQQAKSSEKSKLQERKSIQPKNLLTPPLPNRLQTLKHLLLKPVIHEMPDVIEDIEKSSQGSLEVQKKIITKKNMNAHPKLPIQQTQEKPKQLAQSRLIIIQTGSRFQLDKSDQCDSPLIKNKVKNTSKKDSEKVPPKSQKKQQAQHLAKQEKSQVKENQQKSLNLLIKAIHLKSQQAIITLQAALKQAPNNLSAAQYLSFLYLESSKPRQALGVCNLILDRFEIITKENEQLLINLQNNKSAALNMLGRYSQAIVLLERCIKFIQKDTLLKNLGDAYYFSSNYQKAVFYYEKTVRMSPHYDEAYYNMAACLYLQNNFHNAHQSIVKALETAPKNPEYLQLKTQTQLKITQSSSL